MFNQSQRSLNVLATSLALAACGAIVFSGTALAGKPDKPGAGDETAPYRVTDLPGFDQSGSSQSNALAVSNPDADGTVLVVGCSWTAAFEPHAVLWEVNAAGEVLAMRDLGTLSGGTESEARAVNDVGMAAGYSTLSDPEFLLHAVVFMPGGSVVDLGTLGGAQGRVSAINNPDDDGVIQVVGEAEATDGLGHGAYWEVDVLGNVFGPISLTDAGNFRAEAISNSGVMVGSSQMIATLAFFDAGILQTKRLGTLGGVYSSAYAVDDFGNAAGESQTADGVTHAFLWQEGSGIRDLGTLDGPYNSYGWGVNVVAGSVQVVGTSETANKNGHAFLWEDGIMVDLNALIPGKPQWLLKGANTVNAAGQIVGTGRVGGRRGEEHGYLLTPNP